MNRNNGNYPERAHKEVDGGETVFYFVDPETKKPITRQTFPHAGDFINGFAAVDGGTKVGWYHVNRGIRPIYRKRKNPFTGAGDFKPNKENGGRLEADVISSNGSKFRINTKGNTIPGTKKPWPT